MRIFVRRAAYPRTGEQPDEGNAATAPSSVGEQRADSARPGADSDSSPLLVGRGEEPGPGRLDEPAALLEPEPEPFIGPVPSRQQARDWALVLQSAGIDHQLRFVGHGWGLLVAPGDLERASAAIRTYERENVGWPPVRRRDRPRHAPSAAAPLTFLLLVLFYFMVTGPSAGGSTWFSQGTADSRLLLSEPWRMITALTLHADAKHVLGNAISGSIFGAIVSRRIGPGAALLAILASGALGNAANALYHLAGVHRSIGASTAVFGAVGILATLQVVLSRKHEHTPANRFLSVLGPIIGGLALLGALGAAPHADLWAHLFGFVAGALIGLLAAALGPQRAGRQVSWRWQLGLGATALVAVVGSWVAAMGA